jgi:hypothetical protein
MKRQMNPRTIHIPYLTIDFSALRSEFSPDGLPRWEGKVVLTFDNGHGRVDTVTANWAGVDEEKRGELVDFEGESEDDTLYAACEAHAVAIAEEISSLLSWPSGLDAHHNDIVRLGLCTCKAA